MNFVGGKCRMLILLGCRDRLVSSSYYPVFVCGVDG